MFYGCMVAEEGCAAGTTYVYRKSVSQKYVISEGNAEIKKLEDAVECLRKKLQGDFAEYNESLQEIYDAEIMILDDPCYIDRAKLFITEQKYGAPDALKATCKEVCNLLESSGDSYISDRCDDVRGITSELIAILSQSETELPDTPCIIVAEELSPGELVLIDSKNILGIITERGSATAHVAVLAGIFGVPYVYGIPDVLQKINENDFVIIDSEKEGIFVNPEQELKEQTLLRISSAKKSFDEAVKLLEADTGTNLSICAAGIQEIENIGDFSNIGVGLIRTEFLFINDETEPSEDRQLEEYMKMVRSVKGRDIVFRTMDLGFDKKAAWLSHSDKTEDSSLRGISLFLSRRELLRTQLRAFMRAAHYGNGNVRIMLPMVRTEWEFDEVCCEIKAVAENLEKRGLPYKTPDLGILIETPEAVEISDRLAKKAKFFSIGTNDLTRAVMKDYEAGSKDSQNLINEKVYSMVEKTVKAAHSNGIKAGVCGWMASGTDTVERLVAMGCDELAVPANRLVVIKKKLIEMENISM